MNCREMPRTLVYPEFLERVEIFRSSILFIFIMQVRGIFFFRIINFAATDPYIQAGWTGTKIGPGIFFVNQNIRKSAY